MEPKTVRLTGLRKSFKSPRGTVSVLEGIDLTIEPGEFFVLVGPSGCGKSTLLNLIAGLEKPTAGTVAIGEQVVADPNNGVFRQPFERDIAMVFQSYALYPHMTVERNIAFPLTNLSPRPPADQIAQRVRKAAQLLRIENLLDRKPAELSGGQRQRVAIGRAIVREPVVFLLDEPLSNLDAKLRMDMRAQLKALQRQLGVTTLYVTHDQMEAMTLGDRIAVLQDGGVRQLGTPVDIYEHPANSFVARFIGSPPMNLFAGTLRQHDGREVFASGALRLALPPEVCARIRDLGGEKVFVGIRPEHITLGAPGGGVCDVGVDVVENTGGEYLVYAFYDEGQIVIRTDTAPSGERVSLVFPPRKVHVFTE